MLDRGEKDPGRLAQPPHASWNVEHLTLISRIRLQATFVHHFRHNPAKPRVHPEGGPEEYAEIIRYDGVVLQVVTQYRRPALAGMRPLDRLLQLHLVDQEHK